MVRALSILTMLLVVGCTVAERADVYSDLSTAAPKLITDTATGGPAGAIIGGASVLATVVSGWLVRKFIQKKYAKPQE